MEIIYIILAHKSPKLLSRLINRLNDINITFVIHIDKNVEISHFQNELTKCSANIYYAERVACAWGHISLVNATLNSINLIIEKKIKFDYTILLSGQDYPIKTNEFIKDFFSRSLEKCYMEVFNEEQCIKDWQKLIFNNRIVNYFLYENKEWLQIEKSTLNWETINTMNNLKNMNFPRKFPLNYKPWAGSQWWSLPKYAIEYIYDFSRQNIDFLDFFNYTYIPDEVFFQTIIMNNNLIRCNIINDQLKYVIWNKNPKPFVFDESNFNDLKIICKENNLFLFARKFDLPKSELVLDELDKILDE